MNQETSETRRVTGELERLFSDLKQRHELTDDYELMLWRYLNALKDYHPETYEHSGRMAVKAREVADFTHLVPTHALVYPCCLHDIGKLDIRRALLDKRVGWTPEDSREMEAHVKRSFEIIHPVHAFSAYVILYADFFTSSNHPTLPNFPEGMKEPERQLIRVAGRLVALIDSWDAAHRRNDRHTPGCPSYLNSPQIKDTLLKENRDLLRLITDLYSAKIFE